MKNYRTMILNADYTPLSVKGWQKAMILLFKGVVYELDFYPNEKIMDSQGRYYPVPAVVAVKKYVKRNINKIPFSRKNVFIRDKLTCQYCKQVFKPNELTYDHVVPRSRWKKETTPTTWTNIVTSCIKCNLKKGDKLPHECGMQPLNKPVVPNFCEVILGLSPWKTDIPDEWMPYLGNLHMFKELYARKT